MNTIKYNGSLYKLASEQHKKCPNGKHWNDTHNKCMPISEELNRMSKGADKAGEEAMASSLQGDHKKAYDAHKNASRQHSDTSNKLEKHGFKELSNKHYDKAAFHDEQSDNHEDLLRAAKNSPYAKPSTSPDIDRAARDNPYTNPDNK